MGNCCSYSELPDTKKKKKNKHKKIKKNLTYDGSFQKLDKKVIDNEHIDTEENIIINKEKKNKVENHKLKKIKPLLIKLYLKLDFEVIINIIHELSNERVGILSTDSLLIYSQTPFKQINQIIFDYSLINDSNKFINFIELKNSDLVLWTLQSIVFYKLSGKKYEIYQIIYEYEEIEEIRNLEEYNLNSILELTNNDLVSCSSYGLVIYSEDNGKYTLKSKHPIDIEVKHIIQNNSNELILLQRKHYYSYGTSHSNYSSENYLISVYNIEKERLYKLVEEKVDKYNYIGKIKISYIIKNEFLFVRYAYKIDIYKMGKNIQLVNDNNEENIKTESNYEYNFKMLKDEMKIEFLCDYIDNLIIVKDFNDIIKVYIFEDNTIKFYRDFPYQMNEMIGIIKLKNNNFIMYSNYEIYLIKHI